MENTEQKINQCPEFPFFGASYPDATCIDGFLYDLDNCDSDGNIYGEKDTPCPFCQIDSFIEHEVGEPDDYDSKEEWQEEVNKVCRWVDSVKKLYA